MIREKAKKFIGVVFLGASILLTACGGGGGGGGGNNDDAMPTPTATPTITPTPTPTSEAQTLSGTAAAGAPIIGTVTIKDALGESRSELIEADGSYTVDVSGMTAPFRLRAQGKVGGRTYKLHSYAGESDIDGTVNITPFTDLIVANTAQQIVESFFDSDETTTLDETQLDAQEDALQSKLQNVFDALGLETAINLLNTSFSADRSGLDAALDIVRVETTSENIVTLTNVLDNSQIVDDISDAEDNDTSLPVNEDDLLEAVTDNQAIFNLFNDFSALFEEGLPSSSSVEPFLTEGFLDSDGTRGEFVTDITTNPILVGLGFAGLDISDLDSEAGTATVTFNVIIEGEIDSEAEYWLVINDPVLGWQIHGNQQIVDMDDLSFHCNDYDGTDEIPGGCGINTSFRDENFDNNGTEGAPIASGTVSLIDGADGETVKHIIYLGNPESSAPGEILIYNEASGQFNGDWRAFGSGLGEVDPALFEAGDIVEYRLYTAELDTSITAEPSVPEGEEIAIYTSTLLYPPSTTGLYPTATAETLTALENFDPTLDLTIAWDLVEGAINDEVYVALSDQFNNRVEIWDEFFGGASSTTIDSALFETEILDAGFDLDGGYELRVRIYAEDAETGQFHSTDYFVTIPPVEDDFSIDLTGRTATSVVTNSECPGVPGGFDYEFTADSMTLTGADGWQTPECILSGEETSTITLSELREFTDFPLNCADYPICTTSDFENSFIGLDIDNRNVSVTNVFDRESLTITSTKVLLDEDRSYTEVITIQ